MRHELFGSSESEHFHCVCANSTWLARVTVSFLLEHECASVDPLYHLFLVFFFKKKGRNLCGQLSTVIYAL